MKIDHDYLKELLEAFEVSDEPVTNIERLAAQGFTTLTISLFSI